MFTMRKTIRFVSVVGALGAVSVFATACRGASNEAAAAETTSAPQQRTVAKTAVGTNPGRAGAGTPLVPAKGHELAAFAEGCFWGSENTFRHVPGVVATAVGYTGGTTSSPTYDEVSSHGTGHAETVLVEYDPSKVSYAQLLGVFFRSHDPTTKNRQGPDVGSQYRSAIFTFSAEQEAAARTAMAEAQTKTKKPVVTQISALGRFWIAEDYHQQYDEKTGRESCPLPSVLGNTVPKET